MMSSLGRFSIFTRALLYSAIALAGVFFLAGEPGPGKSTDGYGITRPAVREAFPND
jgi:hypothetical protein